MIGYKIVERNRDGSFRSLYIRGPGETRYTPNEKVVPNPGCGNLLVFNTLPSALAFFRLEELSSLHYAIFRCEYAAAPDNLPWYETVYFTMVTGYRFMLSGVAPDGSRRAESVTLLEEVYPW